MNCIPKRLKEICYAYLFPIVDSILIIFFFFNSFFLSRIDNKIKFIISENALLI